MYDSTAIPSVLQHLKMLKIHLIKIASIDYISY